MISRGSPPGSRRRGSAALLIAASVQLYGALLVLYPKAFRRRYSEEMRRDFRELLREGLEEGGATELVRVWAQVLSDLVLTVLKERSTTSASRYAAYLSVDPRIARRAAAGAMVAVVLVAVAVSWGSYLQTPTYAASAQVLVGWQQGDQQTYVTRSGEEIQPLPPSPSVEKLQELTQAMVYAIDSRPVAQEAIQRWELETTPDVLLDNLTVEQVEGTQFIVLTYEDSDPMRARQIANTVGEVSSKHISERSSPFRATVWEKAALPEYPVSPRPLRNGLLTLVIGLVLSTVLVLPRPRLLAARVADSLVGRAVCQGVGEAGAPALPPADPSVAERSKEQELLQALGRRGKLTAVGAALETSLSVEESRRILEELAFAGHLQVTVERNALMHHPPRKSRAACRCWR
jgi:capsular polysaccharide biosynthesis protein